MSKPPAATVKQTVNATMGVAEWMMLITLSVLWGGSFFFNEIAIRDLPAFTVVVCRVALAAAILLLVLRLMGQNLPRSRQVWTAFFGMGFLNNVVPFSLIVWGQIHVASGVASILNATTPLFTVLIAHQFTADEKMTPARLLGVVIGLVGVTWMIGTDVLADLGIDVLAQVAILAGAISYGFAGVFGRRFRTLGITPMATATGQVCAATVMMVPLVVVVDQPWTLAAPSAATIGALVGIAALSTALAYILYFRILATAGATNLLLVTFLIPLSAILLGVLILGETLQAKHLIGMALIGAGLAAIDGRLFRVFRRQL